MEGAKTGICNFYLTIFERTPAGKYVRYDEAHRERRYSQKKLTDTLAKCGFEFLAIYDGMLESDSAPHPASERWTMAARAIKKDTFI